jgi:hypothetical protein
MVLQPESEFGKVCFTFNKLLARQAAVMHVSALPP